jgi:hypothetical protein
MKLQRHPSKKRPPSRQAGGEKAKSHDEPKSHDEQKENDKDVPVWLQLTAGAIAILAFAGITDYHQLESALGLQGTPSVRHTQASTPRPTAPLGPQSPGPLDPQDAATCTSAITDIKLLDEPPMYSLSVESQFYLDQSGTFYGLGKPASTLALRQDLGYIQLVTLALGGDYRNEEDGDLAGDHSASDLASLQGYESKTETYCSENAGVSG